MDIDAIERVSCIRFILREQESGQLKKEVTAYYGYFVANAIGKQSKQQMLDFIKAYYLPIAQQYGTLWEKSDDQASLAHGWSVGIAQLIQSSIGMVNGDRNEKKSK